MVGGFLCASAARLLAHGAPLEGAREEGGGGGAAHPRDVRQALCQESRREHYQVLLDCKNSLVQAFARLCMYIDMHCVYI